ncbi:serine/threonine protein kinase [Streptomyces argenteolus]|uniref:serine/threonine protein kinase n=1 Tax=Streptomyces sp. NPDC025273 TaxID=3155251 RepID=UPI00337CEF36
MSSAIPAGLFQPLTPGDPAMVGGYRLVAVLGTGGMGKVYLSYTPGGRPIALKVIRPEFSEDPEFRRRFQQEVRAAQRVQGLYTAPVIDFDTEGAQPWLATAYVPGPSLAHAVAQHGRLPLRSVLLLTVGCAEALHVIHGAGIVHRDLKPANVLLAADGPRVIDFGIARAADATALTGNGVSVGTPAFMAPEQAAAGTVTAATDIFALGQIVAYAALGVPAYGDGPSHAVLYRIVHEEPDLSGVPAELGPLVTRCLSRTPADRPSLPEIIELCNEISPVPLRQGEDWLPRAVAGSITERLQLPEPAKTPPPMPTAAPTPTEISPQQPPVQGAHPYAPHGGGMAAAPTQTAPGMPGAPRMPGVPGVPGAHGAQGAVPPGYGPAPGYPASPPGYRTPAGFVPGHPTQPAHQVGFAPAAPRRKRTGLIVGGAVAASVVVLAVVASSLGDGSGEGDDAKARESAGPAGSTSSDKEPKRTDPRPASYKGIDMTANYQVMLADSPPRPADGGDSGVSYNHGDLYYYYDSVFGDEKLGTDNGKLVLLNNAQKGSLETCREETRYTETIAFDQLTKGSEICVLSDGGHIAVATYRGKASPDGPSKYVTLDLTIWRNAEEPKADS